MKLIVILSAVLLTASVFGQTFVDNGAAGTSFTGMWMTSSIAGSYGAAQSAICNSAGSTYTFSAPATGIMTVSLWWTADTNRCDAVTVAVFNGASLVGSSILNQRIAGSRWIPIGTFTFTGTARVVLTAGTGGYTVADGLKLEYGGEPPPPPLPTSKFLLSWTAVTTYVDGTPCAPTGYEIWATPATVDLVASPADDTGAVKRMVPSDVTSNVDATALIVSSTKSTWRLWVRTMANGLNSLWSNPVMVTYDPTLSDPIVPVAPMAPVVSGTVER